jgi:hypothetical protein
MKKFEKIFFSMIAMIMLVAVGSVFTSCTNDDDDFRVPVQETQLDQALGQDSVAPMTRSVTSSDGWERVSDDIKEAYYNAYLTAKSNYYLQNCYITVGFNAAYNATHGTYNHSNVQYYLSTLCSNYSGATYHSYTTSQSDKNHFINDIKYFVTNYNAPVVVLAKTNSWGSGNITQNILTVWAVSDDYVRVTKISTTPASQFGNNEIITLTWDDFFYKATNVNANHIANVAVMGYY